MDRAAKLAAIARTLIASERKNYPEIERQQTRAILFSAAVALGFAEDGEAAAGTDQAFTDAGTTP